VVIHELGHFITAKLAGVSVLEFGIGYPPKIWGKKFGETEYTINWLPLGGFVRLVGEEDPSDPRSLARRPRWIRLIVLASGSIMNLLLPILLFAIAFMIPQEISIGRPIIADVVPDSPAAEAGLQPGDVIYEAEGRETRNLADLSRAIQLNLGEQLDLKVKRGTEFVQLDAKARWVPPDGQGPLGIRIASQYPFTETESYPVWEAVPKGFQATWETVILARNQIIALIKGGGESEGPAVSGPVGIAQATGEVVEEAGWEPLLEFAALLSLNLGVVNILPLPMLDGGRIAFVVLEILRGGKRISPQKEGLVHFIGFVLMISFVVIVSYFDVLRLISGDNILE
ncbi:MAG TPA: M50 family metallopeptidase, partial [Dehalococcoidia bacterium]|nr:M50 family metallopeptidase [Dehalococcoidia bacterium]